MREAQLRIALLSNSSAHCPPPGVNPGGLLAEGPVAYALRAPPQTSVSATLLRQTEWRCPGLGPANFCTITAPSKLLHSSWEGGLGTRSMVFFLVADSGSHLLRRHALNDGQLDSYSCRASSVRRT